MTFIATVENLDNQNSSGLEGAHHTWSIIAVDKQLWQKTTLIQIIMSNLMVKICCHMQSVHIKVMSSIFPWQKSIKEQIKSKLYVSKPQLSVNSKYQINSSSREERVLSQVNHPWFSFLGSLPVEVLGQSLTLKCRRLEN